VNQINNKTSRYSLAISDVSKTGLAIVSCFDSETNYIVRNVLPNQLVTQVASKMAFAGAKISRSKLTFEQIFQEVHKLGAKAQIRLATLFREYGHASIAEMAMLFVFIENIPDLYTTKLFYNSAFHAGQQRSTRYQNFSNPTFSALSQYVQNCPNSLEQDFLNQQKLSSRLYSKWSDTIQYEFSNYFEIDSNDKDQVSALTARTLDTARSFLLSGITNQTSMCLLTHAREWARLISICKGDSDPNFVKLGEQIEFLLAPTEEAANEIGYTAEAPDLIRYTNSDETTKNVSKDVYSWYLDEYLIKKNLFSYHSKKNDTMLLDRFIKSVGFSYHSTQKVKVLPIEIQNCKPIIQVILASNPSLEYAKVAEELVGLSLIQKQEVSHIMYEQFDCYAQLPQWLETNINTFILDCSYGEYRDFNRHRPWGRFVPMLCGKDLVKTMNYGVIHSLYLDLPAFKHLKNEFLDDLLNLQENAINLAHKLLNHDVSLDYLAPQLSVFGANCRPVLHASTKGISYFTDRRVKPGGHINYRHLAYQMSAEIAKSDPFMAGLKLANEPNPDSREEFLDRS
jgi:thymidylate synthase ThyX